MRGSIEMVKGRIEEAAGVLSGSDKLRTRGHENARRGISIMEGSTEVVMGRIEEAAGLLTGNAKLHAKGLKDQAVGHGKQTAGARKPQGRKVARKRASAGKK